MNILKPKFCSAALNVSAANVTIACQCVWVVDGSQRYCAVPPPPIVTSSFWNSRPALFLSLSLPHSLAHMHMGYSVSLRLWSSDPEYDRPNHSAARRATRRQTHGTTPTRFVTASRAALGFFDTLARAVMGAGRTAQACLKLGQSVSSLRSWALRRVFAFFFVFA